MKLTMLMAALCAFMTLPFHLHADSVDKESKGSDTNIVGHVTDKNSKEHIPYITIILKGTTIGTVTDQSGHYFLKNLPEGSFTIEVSCMGYKTITREITLEKGKTLELNFEIEEDQIFLDGVVVSANRTETTRRKAPTLVNVINSVAFEATSSTSVADALVFQPGVRVENKCQNCGFQQVRINGLDGPYTQILIDSRPIFNALSGVYGIEQLPVNMVDRVEVMRGGGSALFGSSAIAGTINIITKEPLYNTASLSHNYTAIGGFGASDNVTMLNGSLVSENHKIGIAVFGQNRERSGYDANGDGYTEIPKLNAQTLGARAFLKTSSYSRLTAEYHHLNEYRRGGDSLSRPPHEAEIAEEVKHSINTGSLKFDYFAPNERHRFSIFGSVQNIERDSYYGAGKNPDAYGRTDDFTWIAGGQYHFIFHKCLFMPAELTAGIEYNSDHLSDYMPGYERKMNQNTFTASIFVQNEWKNDKWGILIGGRLDKHNLINHVIFSPRANLRFNPTDKINLRASYSMGFRAPQAFDEDLHIDNVGGTVSMIKLADNLREEKSQSLSLSGDFYFGNSHSDWRGNLLVEGFYTYLYDVFAIRDIGKDSHGILIKERYNESGAQVYGGTIEGKVAWRDLFQIQAGFTLQRALYNEARKWCDEVSAERRMFRTPDTYGYITATCTPVKELSIALTGSYTGRMLIEHYKGYIPENRTETSQAFFDMGLKVGYDFKILGVTTLGIYAGVKNILNSFQKDFDMGPDRDSKYMYGPGMPRSYTAGIKLSF